MMGAKTRASLWFFLAALVGCTSLGGENQTDVRVVDLKLRLSPIGWKDNETIVVIGDNGERYSAKDGALQTVLRIMTVNYKTQQREVFGKVGGEYCFSDGYAMYVFPDRATDELWVSFGELGKETLRRIKPGELNFDDGPTGSCRPRDERPPRPQWLDADTRIWSLWPRLGLIDCRSKSVNVRTRDIKARFHAPEDKEGVDLPFSCYEIFRGLRYYPFKGAYFSLEFDFRSPWPAGKERRAFWLYPDGKVETIVFPYSTAIRAQAVPSVRGLVAFADPTTKDGDYGVYLATAQSTKRILRGHASGITSPDGCKVAILHDPDFAARLDRRPVTSAVSLKVLELC